MNNMNKKLEKLKEVNETLKNVLMKLETYVFVENINLENIKKNKEENPKVVMEIKR